MFLRRQLFEHDGELDLVVATFEVAKTAESIASHKILTQQYDW
jgi:hypothetical protein